MLVNNNIKNKMLHTLVAMVRNKQKFNPEHLYKPVCGELKYKVLNIDYRLEFTINAVVLVELNLLFGYFW